MLNRKIGFLGVPSSIGAYQAGAEKAPSALRAAGLVSGLQKVHPDVKDYGDLPTVIFRPDKSHPREQNLEAVYKVAVETSHAVDEIVNDNALPFVIGGDCIISLGVLSSLTKRQDAVGLLYFDGDLDLNTPDVTPSGILDGMALAHITGKGATRLAHLSSASFPLVPEHRIAVFGYNPDAGWIDPYELEALERSSMLKFSISEIRNAIRDKAVEALRTLEDRSNSILVHFDVDVLDADEFPSVAPHTHGLSFSSAMEALSVFLDSSKLGGFVITEFNADLDVNGMYAQQLSTCLSHTFQKSGNRKTPVSVI